MLRKREPVVASPAHRGIDELVGCGGGGRSMLWSKLEHARRMSDFHQRSRRDCARYLNPTKWGGPGGLSDWHCRFCRPVSLVLACWWQIISLEGAL